MFLPKFLSHVIASLVYKADRLTRLAMVSGFSDHNERSYMGAVAGYSVGELLEWRILGKNVNVYFDVRDTHNYDGIIIFRIRDKVKIGICEAKLLRFQNRANGRGIVNIWDKPQNPPVDNDSHFYRQFQKFDKVSSKVAKWYMFALDLDINRHSPPLQGYGSSCVWHDNMKRHILRNGINGTQIWTLNDVTNIPGNMHNNLYEIIYDILQCNKGIPFRAPNGTNRVEVKIKGANAWTVPVPSYIDGNEKIDNIRGLIREFMEGNSLGFYSYYDLTNLVE